MLKAWLQKIHLSHMDWFVQTVWKARSYTLTLCIILHTILRHGKGKAQLYLLASLQLSTDPGLLIYLLYLTGSGRLWGGHLHGLVSIRHAPPCPPSAHTTGSRQPGISVSGALPGPETFSTGLFH